MCIYAVQHIHVISTHVNICTCVYKCRLMHVHVYLKHIHTVSTTLQIHYTLYIHVHVHVVHITHAYTCT